MPTGDPIMLEVEFITEIGFLTTELHKLSSVLNVWFGLGHT